MLEQVVVHDQEQQVLQQLRHNELFTVRTIVLQIFFDNSCYLHVEYLIQQHTDECHHQDHDLHDEEMDDEQVDEVVVGLVLIEELL